jgi:hypothetical protein
MGALIQHLLNGKNKGPESKEGYHGFYYDKKYTENVTYIIKKAKKQKIH